MHLKVACIILHDQIARHVYRGNDSMIQHHLQIALDISKTLEGGDWDLLKPCELCFVLLPDRHSMNIKNIDFAVGVAWNALKTTEDPLLKRFIKATYERRPLNDYHKTIIRIHPLTCDDELPLQIRLRVFEYYPLFDEVESESDIVDHPCYRAIDEWAALQSKKSKNIIVSLSGGKDSMITSYILAKLRAKYGFVLSAVHINYANRGVANAYELQVLEWWCSRIDVCLYIRTIDEINRRDCMLFGLREIYESYTRRVRFDTYKQVWKHLGEEGAPIVFLGHNKDDCFENIMTNITQQKKYGNLLGMEHEAEQEGILFCRPLLEVTKKEIIEFTRRARVPYLPTSTPVWSQRGQIRNSILPAIEKWDPRFEGSMFELAERVTAMSKMVDMVIKRCIDKTIGEDDGARRMEIEVDELCMINNVIFWEGYLDRVLGTLCLGTNRPSRKAVQDLVNRVSKWIHGKERDMKVMLRKNIYISFTKANDANIMSKVKIT